MLPVAALAQEITPQSQPLKFGINAGATYAGIRGNNEAEKSDYALDYLVGVSLEVPLSERLSLITNLNYERISYKRDYYVENPNFDPFLPPDGYEITVRATMQYLTLPVNLKYYVGASKKFYINGGAFAGYFLDGISKVNGDKINDDYSIFKDFNFGANLGVGVRFPVSDTSDINIELRDNLGLANISKVPVVGDGSVKTNSVNLMVIWQFGL
ncbi:Outer membrane protein beta-barrel domain-containing protein [Flavobacterium akiainvivens]|nr:Outer membrane protein beta-barrel domain-containing protein [Flavobacterium akiainvivens]